MVLSFFEPGSYLPVIMTTFEKVTLSMNILMPCSPKLATTADSKHQSAPDQHGHEVERSTRRVWGAVELRSARKLAQNDVEGIVH